MDMSIREIIAKNITGLRKQKGLTQSELADILSYSNKSISKWENGDSLPDVEMLYKIAKTFDVDVNYLFEEHTYKDVDFEQAKMLKKRQTVARIRVGITFALLIIICVFVFILTFLHQYTELAPWSIMGMTLLIAAGVIFFAGVLSAFLKYVKYLRVLTSMFIWVGALGLYFILYQARPLIIFPIALILQLGLTFLPRLDSIVYKNTMKKIEKENRKKEENKSIKDKKK